jgi:hypothetical protein
MFWTLAGEVFKNPIAFIIAYFITGINNPIITVFVTSILASIGVYLVTFLGIGIYKKIKGKKFKKVALTSIIMVLIVTIFMAIWSFLFNPEYLGPFANGILAFIIGFVFLSIITGIGIEIGIWFSEKMENHWTMPEKLRIYLSVFGSLLVIFGLYMLYVYIGLWLKGI